MPKLIRVLVLGATLAAMNLASMITVAQAQASDEPNGNNARPPAGRQVGKASPRRPLASHQQTTGDAALRRTLARERFSVPSETPAQVPAPVPAEPGEQRGWLVAPLGLLAAALALAGGLVVLAKRSGRRVRAGPAA
jgi:hypothetical protein